MESNGTSKSNIINLFKFLNITFLMVIVIICCCIYRNNIIYNEIGVVLTEDVSVKYGANSIDLSNYVADYNGDTIELVKDIDTNVVGKQELIVEITKGGVKKDIPILIDVIDDVAPVIELKDEKIVVNEGESYDFSNNINLINDNVNGDLNYISNSEINDDLKNYYTYYSDSDVNSIGTHNIIVKAIDNSGNVTEKTFEYVVNKIIKVEPVAPQVQLNYNLPANGNASGIVNLAYSLIGSRYVSGGTTPAGFDCSGFVQYVLGQNGVHVSRSSYTQAYDGVAVPYSEAQPGDILSWGTSIGNISHSALYVGNGMMIHATNPSQGVLLSNVEGWTRGSGTHVVTVRRIL